MTLSLKEELRRTFELATLRQEAKTLRTSRHWRQVDDLMHRARSLREREAHLYAKRYDTRVEITRRRLIDDAAKPARTFQPNWAGLDRFSSADVLRQARREVQSHHDRRISRIKEAEARGLGSIVQQAARENAIQGTVRAAFERAAGPDRDRQKRMKSGPTQD